MASAAGIRDKCILGPGASKLSKGPDLSQLKPPIRTSVSGTKQIIHAMESGTGEIKNYLLNEINLMYECKTCFSVFRSVANLVAHKRTFCKAKYDGLTHMYKDKEGKDATEMQTVIIEAEPVDCVIEDDKWNFDNYAPSYELLKTSGVLNDICNGPRANRLLPARKIGLHEAVAKLKATLDGSEEVFNQNMERNFEEASKPTQIVHLEPMYETENAMIQSWKYSEEGETLGEQYMAWQSAENDKKWIKIGPNGQVTTAKETIKLVTGPKGETYSVKVPANAFDEGPDSEDEEFGYMKYPCTKCKRTFTKLMKVFNHLVNAHNFTMQEAKSKKQTIKDHAIYVDGKKKSYTVNGNFPNPVKPMEVKLKNFTLSTKIPVNLCQELSTIGTTTCPILGDNCFSQKSVTNGQEVTSDGTLKLKIQKKEECEDSEIVKKIMESVNRRKMECRICNKKFAKTSLIKDHVAEEHLKLSKAHRLRDVPNGILEQPKEKFFRENETTFKVDSTTLPSIEKTLDNQSDQCSTHSSSTTLSEDENDHIAFIPQNGIIKPVSSEILDEENEESSDVDTEVSFGGSVLSSLPSTLDTVTTSSESTIEKNEDLKRKRGPSVSPIKLVISTKRSKIIHSEEDLKDADGYSSSLETSKVMQTLPRSCRSSISSPTLASSKTNVENLQTFKVPEAKKILNIVHRVSDCEEDLVIKDLDAMERSRSRSRSRGSNSSRSDVSISSSEIKTLTKNSARSRSSSGSSKSSRSDSSSSRRK